MTTSVNATIPSPLVKTNQSFIVLCVIATWLTGAFWLLFLPLLAGVLGLAFNYNPVLRVAKLFLRKPPSTYTQEDKGQQNFNQLIATTCLTFGIIGYLLHWPLIAYGFTFLVALAATVALLGFCVGCFLLFQWKQYQYRVRTRRALKL